MYKIDQIIELRRNLHKTPEISGGEKITALKILDFLSDISPDKIHRNFFGEAIMAEFVGKESGPTILFRCDMDAVPVREVSNVVYKSVHDNCSHACGHDGHMAMMLGLAALLKENKIGKGKALLLFQPAEEIGTGAKGIVDWLVEQNIAPDFAFAIHNLPGHPEGSIIIAKHTFSAASTGLIINLVGKQSHAAYPEHGINPALAISEIVREISILNEFGHYSGFTLATIISISLGEKAFGTSPGKGKLMLTLRSYFDSDLQKIVLDIEKLAQEVSKKNLLDLNIEYMDAFPACVCDPEFTLIIESIAKKLDYPVVYLDDPNRWSEDFAHFTQKYPSVIIGIGAGENYPNLHTANYDFPDDILPVGISLMDSIVNLYLRDNNS